MAAERLVHAESLLPTHRVDFERPVVCILGLPFDAIGMDEAVACVRTAATENRRCWIATPNLNFVMTALGDPAFRRSVLACDLSLADGMPVVWAARLLGLPLRERVAGSDLFEALQAHAGPPLTVYLYGGPPGAAELAAQRINARGGGVRCVGFDGAGYGDIESLSDEATIARINASGARFVVVAMGARKGQAWIAHNAARLVAPVLCHLGAVMNFAAGTLRRAPPWARRAGLEWLWRIAFEEGLWRRYYEDGRGALALVMTRLLPDALSPRSRAPADAFLVVPAIEQRLDGDTVVLRPTEAVSEASVAALRTALTACADSTGPVRIDLGRVKRIGHAFAALLLLAEGWFDGGFSVVNAGAAARTDLRRMLASDLLDDSERRRT